MSRFSSRAIAGAVAIGATLVIFWLWSLFGDHLMAAMNAVDAPAPKPAVSSDGAYTVDVLPPPKDCPKDKPC
jgi:hypothetical protein